MTYNIVNNTTAIGTSASAIANSSIFAIHPPGANTYVNGTSGSSIYTIDSAVNSQSQMLKLDPYGKIVNVEAQLKVGHVDIGAYVVATADYLGLLIRDKEYEAKWDSLRDIGEQHTATLDSETEFGQHIGELRRLRKAYHEELARIMECETIVSILKR